MRPYEELVSEAVSADITGWSFGWLDGRAVEQRPPWGYARLLADALSRATAAVDLDTGGGEVVNEAPDLPPTMVVTESWPPNVKRAHELLGPRGVRVVPTVAGQPLPFPDESFDLVTARHPVRPQWDEIHRVLRPGGRYFAQHVGPESAFELIEFFVGPLPRAHNDRDPHREVAAAEAAWLSVSDVRTARCRMELYDIGAVVWILRKCVWWVPDFTVTAYEPQLRELDARLRGGQPFVARSSRHLIEARRPVGGGR